SLIGESFRGWDKP
ncbi:hypothetical protein D047_3873B, partial [Vibrio parahaemolyticus VPTS-2010_2]